MIKTFRFISLLFCLLVLSAAALSQSWAAVRFVALGDAGEGNFAQYQVGIAMQQICAQKGCDFALYLGDNFYDDGVNSSSDSQFSSKFELPYAGLDIPFYVVAGNHDYGRAGVEFWKPWYEISYTYKSPTLKWKMPWYYYQKRIDNVEIFGIDSQSVFLGWTLSEQSDWLNSKISQSSAQWKIVFAHHPFISNGQHGNAGNYEGCFFCPIIRGDKVKKFVKRAVCGKADFYFSGHDHNLQWLKPKCGTGFIVSGAGSKTTSFRHRDDNPVFAEFDNTAGFTWVEIDGNRFTGTFYDLYGNQLYSRTETK